MELLKKSCIWNQIRQYLINHEKKQNSFNTINTYFVFYYFYSLRLQYTKLDVIYIQLYKCKK